VKSIAEASQTGPATNIIAGVAVGLECTAIPVIVISIAIIASYYIGGMSGVPHAGLFGTAVATMGMLGTAAYILAMDTFGPISDNAQGIAEMSGGVGQRGAQVLTSLDAVGNTTKAITKGIAIATAVLAATAGNPFFVTEVLAAHGADIPATVRDAVLAAEDARFYAHGALDLRGILRATVVDLTSHRLQEGGSSIAQQYVKNVVTGDRRSLHRKLVEAVDAAALERTTSKDRILAAYLNQVYFGDGVYGIATAAQHYFSRPVGKLSLAQAAALAALDAEDRAP